MIPLKTLPNTRVTPYLTRSLVALNVLAFGVQLWYRLRWDADIAQQWGVRSHCYISPGSCGVFPFQGAFQDSFTIDFLTSKAAHWLVAPLVALFLHGDWLHIGFNLLFLWVFGAALEGELGRVRFLLIYGFGGLVAALTQTIVSPLSNVPAIGASGAIAALLGAFLFRLPKAWVLTYFPPVYLFPVPAPLFLVVWFGFQLMDATHDLSFNNGIAWGAHVGGFLFGALYAFLVRSPARKPRRRTPRHSGRAETARI